MFKLYVVLASQAKVTDAGRADTCRRKFEAPTLQTKCKKNEGHPENTVFNGETV